MKNTTRRTFTLASLIRQPRWVLLGTAQASFVAVIITTGGLTLGTPTPALADHRDVGDGECSWFPDRGLDYDFHEACTNHDACGERAGSNQLAWDACDRQLRVDAQNWCNNRWRSWYQKPAQLSCRSKAETMYWGLRAFVNGTGIHRD